MAAIRILLISQLFACLWISSPTCQACETSQACVPFTGLNGCVRSNTAEPDMPPIDNACCGPQCTYGALNGDPGTCDSTTSKWRCLLDTHCGYNVTFIYRQMTDCEFRQMNINRISAGQAREYLKCFKHLFPVFIRIFTYSGLLSFNWNEATCLAQNTKCGLTCCCRETCPTQFCKIESVTTCPSTPAK